MARSVIFLSGPIGVGKTTLGRALAERLSAGFIDGDDLCDPDRPWYCSSLRTSQRIVQSAMAVFQKTPVAVIAYPIRCTSWIYFRRTFENEGVRPFFITLRASFPSIVSANRGRAFSPDECARIRVMIAEGYGARPFSDLVVDTDTADFATTLARLEQETRRMIEHSCL